MRTRAGGDDEHHGVIRRHRLTGHVTADAHGYKPWLFLTICPSESKRGFAELQCGKSVEF